MWRGRDDGRAVLGLGSVLVCVPSLRSEGRAGIYPAARKVHNPPGNSQGKAAHKGLGLMGKGFSANPAPRVLCEQGLHWGTFSAVCSRCLMPNS